MSKLKFALYPFSAIIGGIVRLRHWLYDRHILPSKSFSLPIIKIGNLNLGGTGKTPHSEYVLDLLHKKEKVALLSRGYGRKTKGYVLASKTSTPSEIGDEAYQIYRKIPKIQVAVDEKRPRGIENLIHEGVDVVVLDDALQHRPLAGGMRILLMEFGRPIHDDYLWPTGTLRDIRSRLKETEIMIVTKCPDDLTKSEQLKVTDRLSPTSRQNVFFTKYQYLDLEPVFESGKKQASHNTYDNILLFSGIAKNSALIEKTSRACTNLRVEKFEDHHHYSVSDIERLKKIFDSFATGSNLIVTTEKDAVKLKALNLTAEQKKLPIYYLPIKVKFLDKEEQFEQLINDYVRENKRNR